MSERTDTASMDRMHDTAAELARRRIEEKKGGGVAKIDPATTERLGLIVAEFRSANDYAETILRSAVVHYMDMADLLIEARELFEGDKEYGQWRAEALPEFSATWCGRIAQIRSDERLAPLIAGNAHSISILTEMVSLPDAALETIANQAEKPTVAQIRRDKKTICGECGHLDGHADDCTTNAEAVVSAATSQPKPTPLASAGAAPKPRKEPAAAPIEVKARMALRESFMKRLSAYNPVGDNVQADPFIVLGIGSLLTETLPTQDTIDIVVEARWVALRDKSDGMKDLFQTVVDNANDMKDNEESL